MKEYIEQTATNADGIAKVEKIKTPFAYIIVGGDVEKPCYSIMWLDPTSMEFNIGYSSYYLPYVRQWLKEDFEIVEGDADLVDRKRGEWKKVGFGDFLCSTCGVYQSIYTGGTNFCPNCGADMREVTK